MMDERLKNVRHARVKDHAIIWVAAIGVFKEYRIIENFDMWFEFWVLHPLFCSHLASAGTTLQAGVQMLKMHFSRTDQTISLKCLSFERKEKYLDIVIKTFVLSFHL